MSEKSEFTQRYEQRMNDLQANIDLLAEKYKSSREQVSETSRQELEELKRQRSLLNEKLDEIKQSADGMWKEVAEGVDEAWKDLSSHLKQLRHRFE
ncbi:MAG: hypothetical protein SVU69_06460 [Pseudomonadota bacterium]|nr:hypothetical protein [Pseudomonadota bacterium]